MPQLDLFAAPPTLPGLVHGHAVVPVAQHAALADRFAAELARCGN